MGLELLLQGMDLFERERVLLSVDETRVRLVPGEGRAHVSKKAYWLVEEGVPMGRRASLAVYGSTTIHVAAISDMRKFSGCCPEGGPSIYRRRAGANLSNGGVQEGRQAMHREVVSWIFPAWGKMKLKQEDATAQEQMKA